jgi:putative PIN family toxin of toxin-antitoxin system
MAAGPIIVDTNVIISGLLSQDETSPVARVLNGMLTASFAFVLSERLLAEYRSVLPRPRLAAAHGLTLHQIDALLDKLLRQCVELNPAASSGPVAPDREDQMLWDLLGARADLRLVTGDRRLLEDFAMRGRVISPRELVDAAPSQSRLR